MPYIEVSTIVQGSRETAYQMASDMESYPRFMENVISVKVLERGKDFTVTQWEANAAGRIIKWQEKDIFDAINKTITYEQIKGDLKKFQGQWLFKEFNQGTEIVLTVDFDLGIPMLSGLLNPILQKITRDNSQAMLDAIKKEVEGQVEIVC